MSTVVGVAPRGFAGIDRERIDAWIRISSIASESMGTGWHNTNNNWWAQIIVRVRSGVTPEMAASQATLAYRGGIREWDESRRTSSATGVLSSIIGTRSPNGVSRACRLS